MTLIKKNKFLEKAFGFRIGLILLLIKKRIKNI